MTKTTHNYPDNCTLRERRIHPVTYCPQIEEYIHPDHVLGTLSLPTGEVTVTPRLMNNLDDNPEADPLTRQFLDDLAELNETEDEVTPRWEWSRTRREQMDARNA